MQNNSEFPSCGHDNESMDFHGISPVSHKDSEAESIVEVANQQAEPPHLLFVVPPLICIHPFQKPIVNYTIGYRANCVSFLDGMAVYTSSTTSLSLRQSTLVKLYRTDESVNVGENLQSVKIVLRQFQTRGRSVALARSLINPCVSPLVF